VEQQVYPGIFLQSARTIKIQLSLLI